MRFRRNRPNKADRIGVFDVFRLDQPVWNTLERAGTGTRCLFRVPRCSGLFRCYVMFETGEFRAVIIGVFGLFRPDVEVSPERILEPFPSIPLKRLPAEADLSRPNAEIL